MQGNCEEGKRCIMDLIERQAAIDAIKENKYSIIYQLKALEELPSAQQWIPFSMRKLTEEEKKLYPEQEYILDGKTPKNGQNILVNIRLKGHEEVQSDEFYDDDGCYLYSGYEIGAEATHWMPLPEPYKDESNEQKN